MRVQTASGSFELGETENTPTISIVDYSRRTTDEFGVTTVVPRGFARRMSVRLALATSGVDALQQKLAELRATSATWVADETHEWLSVEGFYKDFQVDLPAPSISYCTLTVEGIAGTETVADSGADPAPSGQASTLQILQPVTVTDGVLTASNVPETDYPEWASGTTYAAGVRVRKSATHRVYESLVAGNVGHDPASDSTRWLDVRPTNRWAMFDQALGTATSAAGSIAVTLTASDISALALLDVAGTSVRVQKSWYDRTVSVAPGTMTFLDLPSGAGAVTVTVAGSGTVSVGTLLVGKVAGLGLTEASPTAGITDYSRKDVDEFGAVTIVQRAWAKRMGARGLIRSDAVDVVANRIAAVRARPVLWIASAGVDALTIYGFFKDFSIEVGPSVSKLSLTVEGLSKAAALADPLGDLATQLAQAQADATTALSETSAALASIARMQSDGWLSAGEKPDLIRKYADLANEYPVIVARLVALGGSDTYGYGAAKDALELHLGGLSPAWNDTSADTAIAASTFNGKWVDYYYARALVLSAIDAKAATLANWSGVYDDGKRPEDGATAGGNRVFNGDGQQNAIAETAAVGWKYYEGNTIPLLSTATIAISGSRSLKFAKGSSSDGVGAQSRGWAVKPGEKWVVKVDYLGSPPSTNGCIIRAHFCATLAADGYLTARDTFASLTENTNFQDSTQHVEKTVTVPANCYWMSVAVYSWIGGSTNAFFDNISAEKAVDFTADVVGAPAQSGNLIRSPVQLEFAAVNGDPYIDSAAPGAAAYVDHSGASSPDWRDRIRAVYANSQGIFAPERDWRQLTCKPGDVFYFSYSAWFSGDSGAVVLRPRMQTFDAAGSYLGTDASFGPDMVAALLTGSWRASGAIKYTVPVGVAMLRPLLQAVGGSAGAICAADFYFGRSQPGADVTAATLPEVKGPVVITVAADNAGTPNQPTSTHAYQRLLGGVNVSDTTTASIVSAINCSVSAAIAGTNIVVTRSGAVVTGSKFVLRTNRDGRDVDYPVEFYLDKAPPSYSTGGGGGGGNPGTNGSCAVSGAASGTGYSASSLSFTCVAGTAGTVQLTASMLFSVFMAGFNAYVEEYGYCKVRWRVVGGSYADVPGSLTESNGAAVYSASDGGYSVGLEIAVDMDGLTPGVTYEFNLAFAKQYNQGATGYFDSGTFNGQGM